eukprot:100771-Prorocentrum_minimum.AAC.2
MPTRHAGGNRDTSGEGVAMGWRWKQENKCPHQRKLVERKAVDECLPGRPATLVPSRSHGWGQDSRQSDPAPRPCNETPRKSRMHEFRAHRYRPTLRAKLSSAKRRSKKGAGKRARVLRSNCGQIDEQTVLSVVTGTDSSTFATPEAAAPDAPTSSCGAPSRPAARLELRRVPIPIFVSL